MAKHELEASDDSNTVELDLSDLQGSEAEAEVARRLPQATAVRGAVVAVLGLVGSVIGRNVSADAWLDAALDAYTVAAPALVFLWFHKDAKGVQHTVETAEDYVVKRRTR